MSRVARVARVLILEFPSWGRLCYCIGLMGLIGGLGRSFVSPRSAGPGATDSVTATAGATCYPPATPPVSSSSTPTQSHSLRALLSLCRLGRSLSRGEIAVIRRVPVPSRSRHGSLAPLPWRILPPRREAVFSIPFHSLPIPRLQSFAS